MKKEDTNQTEKIKINFDVVAERIRDTWPQLTPDSDIPFSKFKRFTKTIFSQIFTDLSDSNGRKKNFI